VNTHHSPPTAFRPESQRAYKLIVFDWDGTIANSTQLITRSVQAAYRDLRLPVPDETKASFIIGLRLDEAFRKLSPNLPIERAEEVRQRYLFHYLKEDSAIPLFDGMEALLSALDDAGYFLAVATGKSRKGLDRMLALHHLQHRFHATKTADESASKPSPDMLLELMDRLGVSPQETLMIGDTTHDIQMAKTAGTDAVAVAYGAHSAETLQSESPRAILFSVDEVWRWLISNG
jgi:phosphoglycolate phosphatase